MITFTIPGKVQPKQRARVTKGGHAYTPAKTMNAEAFIKTRALEAMDGATPLEGPLRLSVSIFRLTPKSFSRTKRDAVSSGELYPTTRPDLDNQIKLIKDALNGICFQDDSQVVTIFAQKRYCNLLEQTIVTIEQERRLINELFERHH